MKYLNRRKKYNAGFRALNKLALKYNTTPDEVGKMIIEEKAPEVIRYIETNGHKPPKTIQGIAGMAAYIHEKKIQDKIKQTGNSDYTLAENSVFQDEAEAAETASYNGEEYNDFAPGLLAVIGAVGKKAIEGINKKRESKGKKPILSGAFWQKFKDKTSPVTVAAEGDDLNIRVNAMQGNKKMSDSELAAGWNSAKAELERQAKADYINKNKPLFIIAGIVAVIIIILLIRKYKK